LLSDDRAGADALTQQQAARCGDAVRASADLGESIPPTMPLAEQDDEWQDGRRCFRPETMAAIDAVAAEEVTPLLMAS
jgi:hypothetical protein